MAAKGSFDVLSVQQNRQITVAGKQNVVSRTISVAKVRTEVSFP